MLPDNYAAIQPSFTVDLGQNGFALSVWSSFALAQRVMFKHSDEIDETLTYTFKVPDDWQLTVGFTNYIYSLADDFKFKNNTFQEIYASVIRTNLPLSPQLSVYYDFNLGSGLYATLGGSSKLQVNARVRVEMGGFVGFNSRQYIDKTGFSDIALYARVPLTMNKLTLTPSLNLMIPLLDEVNMDTEIWFGFSATF